MVRNTINPNELNNHKIWNETPLTINNSKKVKAVNLATQHEVTFH